MRTKGGTTAPFGQVMSSAFPRAAAASVSPSCSSAANPRLSQVALKSPTISMLLVPLARTDWPTAVRTSVHSRQVDREWRQRMHQAQGHRAAGRPPGGFHHVRRQLTVPWHAPDLAAGKAQPGGDKETGRAISRCGASVGVGRQYTRRDHALQRRRRELLEGDHIGPVSLDSPDVTSLEAEALVHVSVKYPCRRGLPRPGGQGLAADSSGTANTT